MKTFVVNLLFFFLCGISVINSAKAQKPDNTKQEQKKHYSYD